MEDHKNSVYIKAIYGKLKDGDLEPLLQYINTKGKYYIVRDSDGQSKHFGYIDFNSSEDAKKFQKTFNDKRVGANTYKVSIMPKEPSPVPVGLPPLETKLVADMNKAWKARNHQKLLELHQKQKEDKRKKDLMKKRAHAALKRQSKHAAQVFNPRDFPATETVRLKLDHDKLEEALFKEVIKNEDFDEATNVGFDPRTLTVHVKMSPSEAIRISGERQPMQLTVMVPVTLTVEPLSVADDQHQKQQQQQQQQYYQPQQQQQRYQQQQGHHQQQLVLPPVEQRAQGKLEQRHVTTRGENIYQSLSESMDAMGWD